MAWPLSLPANSSSLYDEVNSREDDGKRQQRKRGRNGRNTAQGLDDDIAPVPLPPGVLLFGSALPALVLMRRRSRFS